MRIYKKGNIIFMDDGIRLYEGLSKNVLFRVGTSDCEDFNVTGINGWDTNKAFNISDIQKEDGTPYSLEEFKEWYPKKDEITETETLPNEDEEPKNSNMSVINISRENDITTIDARQSTTNDIVTGGVSGKHNYTFTGQFNKPKINGTTTPLTLNAGNNSVVAGGVGEKTIAGNTWNSYVYSSEYFNPLTEDNAVSWLVESVEGTIREMAGYDNSPTQNQSYSSIEYAIYQVNNYFYSRVYEKGSPIIIPNYTTFYLQVGDRLGVMCVNQRISYFVLRNGVTTIIYTSSQLATEPLYFKGAFNRGAGSSGEGRLGGVVFHTETEIDSFLLEIEGYSSEIIKDEDMFNLTAEAGIEALSGSTYSHIQFRRTEGDKFKTSGTHNKIDLLHEYRGLANQTNNILNF